jgi:hypothetical protein
MLKDCQRVDGRLSFINPERTMIEEFDPAGDGCGNHQQ